METILERAGTDDSFDISEAKVQQSRQDENTDRNTKQGLPTISKPQENRITNSKLQTFSRSLRDVIAVRNVVRPLQARRKSRVVKDPFLQRFSTRENRKRTPATRKEKRSAPSETIANNFIGADQLKEETSFSDEVFSNIDETEDCYSMWEWMRSKNRLIFDPNGSLIYYWFYFLAFAIRYNLWSVILRIAFDQAHETFFGVWMFFDYVSDAIYIMDIFVSFRMGFLEEGILVKDLRRLAKRYVLSKSFWADMLTLLPFDLLYFKYGTNPVFRIGRIVKSYKSYYIKSVMESQTSHPTFVRVFFLVHLMFLLIHWNACIREGATK